MSYELWRGPSTLDGVTDIVVLVTGNSQNPKSGNQLQTWTLRTDVAPHIAVKQDLDRAICGDCIHRRERSCYVIPFTGPRAAWEHWRKNGLRVPPNYSKGAHVRLGSYGEITAAPFAVTENFVRNAEGFTGFTAQWETCDQRFANYLMASVSSEDEALRAQNMGWRTYRTAPRAQYARAKNEVLCPASKQAGQLLTCAECGYCNGNAKGFSGNVSIPVHGAEFKVRRFEESQQPQVTIVNL